MPDVLPFETVEGTINSLKSATGMVHDQLAYVRQYRTTHLGGGGLFRWDSISTEMPNGGTIIDLNSGGTGRWKRDQVKDALDFGADPTYNLSSLNGTPNTTPDSTSFLREYISWALKNQTVPHQEIIIPKGVYYLADPAQIPNISKRCIVRGAGMQNTILVPNPDSALNVTEVFKIRDTWRGVTQLALADAVAYAFNATDPTMTADQGVTIQDLSIVSKDGCKVRGVVTFGRVSELRLHNIQFSWLRTAVSLGVLSDGAVPGSIRESSFSNLHALHCGRKDTSLGNPFVPAIDIGIGQNATEGSSDLSFDQCSVVYPESIGLCIENLGSTSNPPIQRIRFTSLMLHGSSQKTANKPDAPVMLISGHVQDVELFGVSMNGATDEGGDQACIKIQANTSNAVPQYVTVIGDVRSCDGVGIDVVKCDSLNVVLTVEQGSMGEFDDQPAVRFQSGSVSATAGARVRALSTLGTGAVVEVDASVRPYVLVERASGDITGMRMQRVISTDLQTIQYYDDTLIVNWDPASPATMTLFLPSLADVTIGQEFFVFDGIGNAGTDNIKIQASGSDDIENQPSDFVEITQNWGKRGFRAILNTGSGTTANKWVTWGL